jgi:hypothetical protein
MALSPGFSFRFDHAPQEAAMKRLIFVPLVLTLAMARAQTVTQSQIRHIATSLNHLTVFEYGEAVTNVAVADPDSFHIERQGDKVLVMPLKQGVATNFFVWTPTRELTYELDPAGDVAKMDVLVRTEPAPKPHSVAENSGEPSDAELRKIADLVLTQAMAGVEDVTHEPGKGNGPIEVTLNQIYRSKDALYIRYTVTNQSKAPFRVTSPDVSSPSPTQQPVSLLSLKDRQLTAKTLESFKAKAGNSFTVGQSEIARQDLAPGQTTTGVVSIPKAQGNPPQLYQLNFGSDSGKSITVAAVL